jgi:hypothetical protein
LEVARQCPSKTAPCQNAVFERRLIQKLEIDKEILADQEPETEDASN